MSHYNTTGLCPDHDRPAMKAINGMFLNCCADGHITCKKKCAKQAAKNYDMVEAENIQLSIENAYLKEANKQLKEENKQLKETKKQLTIANNLSDEKYNNLLNELEKVRHENPAYVLELIKHQLATY